MGNLEVGKIKDLTERIKRGLWICHLLMNKRLKTELYGM